MSSWSLSEAKSGAGFLRHRPLTALEVHNRLGQIADWQLVGTQIQKSFSFQNFRDAMAFVEKVAELAEKANHHPDIFISYDKVSLTLWTHEVGKLTESDFDLAVQINDLLATESAPHPKKVAP